MKVDLAIGVMAAMGSKMNPMVCSRSGSACPQDIPVFNNDYCNNCDSMQINGDTVTCTLGSRTSQFNQAAIPYCSRRKDELIDESPLVCQIGSQCFVGLSSIVHDGQNFCFSCDEQDLSQNKCTKNGKTITFSNLENSPYCTSSRSDELPADRPAVCKEYNTCPRGVSSIQAAGTLLCHNCDNVTTTSDGKTVQCSKAGKTISVVPEVTESCSHSKPLVPDMFDNQTVVCSNFNCASFLSSATIPKKESFGMDTICHNCDSMLSGNGEITCQRSGITSKFAQEALDRCSSTKKPLPTDSVGVCYSSKCPLGSQSIVGEDSTSFNSHICHNCDSVAKSKSSGSVECTKDGKNKQFFLSMLPRCLSAPSKSALSASEHLCKTKRECPFGVSSFRNSDPSMFVCSTCDSTGFADSSVTCTVGLSSTTVDFSKIPVCYEQDPLPALASAKEGGVCLGDYSCPAESKMIEKGGGTLCHNCDDIATAGRTVTCTKNGVTKTFQKLSECGAKTSIPSENFLATSPPHLCAVFPIYGECPLFAQVLLHDGFEYCHNCDSASITPSKQSCTRNGVEYNTDRAFCTSRINTSDKPTPSPVARPGGSPVKPPNQSTTTQTNPPQPNTNSPSSGVAQSTSLVLGLIFSFFTVLA